MRRTQAVDTLEGFGTNDDVRDGCAVREDEDSIGATGIGIRVTGLATVELLVAIVLATTDRAGLGQRDDGTRASRDVKSLSRRKAGDERDECDLGEHGERVDLFGES